MANLPKHSEITILDVREAGGGIKDEKVAEAKLLNPYVTWYTDIGSWPGISFPAQCVVVVKIPQTVLTTYGGTLEHRDVVEKVKMHMPFGHYPAIRYYGVTPHVYLDEDSTSTAGSIRIYWDTETIDYKYSVYFSQQEDGPFTQFIEDFGDASPTEYNTQVVMGLTSGTTYWIYVTATIDNIEGAKSVKLKVLCP